MSISPLWPWAVAAALLGVAICVIIAGLILRASRAKTPMVPAPAAGADGAPPAPAPGTPEHSLGAVLAIRRSFSNAKATIKAQTTSASDRLAIPWILSIGSADCGKSTVLASLDLPRLTRGVARHDERAAPCHWHFFEQGIVLDVAGSVVMDDGNRRADERIWHSLLGQLQHHRPERPLDGVVIAIPVTELAGPARLSREALATRARQLGARLAELQHALSLRLPVYVLITKCDELPGFAPLCRAVPPERLHDMLGWSSPYSVDSAFLPAWADEALDAVLHGIQEAEFAALAREEVPTDGDALFLLPLALGRVRSPLRDTLHHIFESTTYERGAFFRGVFFTGDRNAPTAAALASIAGAGTAPAPDAASTPVVADATPAADPWRLTARDGADAGSDAGRAARASAPRAERQPAFVRDLFAQKVFAERGLAQPGPRAFPSKHRTVARMQIATAAIIILGPFALLAALNGVSIGPWKLSNGIRSEEATLRPLLQNIDIAVRQMQAQRSTYRTAAQPAQEVGVFGLLTDMASLSTNHLWSVFLPGTLLSPLHRDITDAIGLSFQTIILPEFRDRLEYRTQRLLDPSTPPRRDDARFGTGLSLPQYLDAISSLGDNLARYNGISTQGTGELEDLADVVHYLYGEEVAPGFLQNDGYYRRALADARARAIVVDSSAMTRAVRRAGELTRSSYTALLSRLSASAIDVDSGDNATSNDDVEALNGLRAFLDTAGPVQHALAGVHPPFVFGDDFAARVRDSLAFYTAQLTGQILPNYADASHTTDAALRVLDALLRQPFMQAPTGKTLDADENAGADLTWDTGRLDDALGLYKQFQAFTAHGFDPLSDGLRTRVRRLATVQVAAAMTDAIADAAHPQAPTTVLSDGDRDLTARITAFEQSAPRILQLLGVLDELGATATYDAVADLSTLNANALLARVDGSLDLANRYRLPQRAVATWNGHAPFSATAFGSRPGALDDFLNGEADAFRSAAQLARPLVGFLESQSAGTTGRTQSLKTWDVILAAVDHADKKPATGPLVTIDAMVRTELDSIDVKSCSHQAPRSTVGGDLFAQRSDAMWSAVWRRCVDVASNGLTSAYARLSSAFRAKLAGRFPFSAPDAGTDAAPADVVDVLRDYDAFMAVARESAGPDEPFGLLSGRADSFLTDLGQVRAFFAPLVDSAATGRPPTLDYQIDFRVNRTHEVGANQIADWTADVADQHLTIASPLAGRRGRWRAGDDVQVALRWATGSPVVPVESAPAGGTVNDETLTIQTHGEWSLLRLVRQYESDIPDPDGGQTVKIGARTARRGPQGAAAVVATPTRAFLRVRLFNPDTKAEFRFPHFPSTAPDLAAEDRR